MKKIVIPAILAATILVAGMFALMPVQKASTVHTTITGNVDTNLRASNSLNSVVIATAGNTIIASSTNEVEGEVQVCVTQVGVLDNTDVQVAIDTTPATFFKVADLVAGCQNVPFTGLGLRVIDADAGVGGDDDTADIVVIWRVGT